MGADDCIIFVNDISCSRICKWLYFYVHAMWVGSRHLYLKDLTQLFSIVMQLGQFIVVVYQDQKHKIYETFFFSITWNLFNSLLDYYSILSTEKHGLEALLTLKIWNYLYFGHLCLIMFSYWSCCIFSLVIFFFWKRFSLVI